MATVTGCFHMDKTGTLYYVLTLHRPSQKPRYLVDPYATVWQRKDQTAPDALRALRDLTKAISEALQKTFEPLRKWLTGIAIEIEQSQEPSEQTTTPPPVEAPRRIDPPAAMIVRAQWYPPGRRDGRGDGYKGRHRRC